jgi:deoxyhypusine monooxygenase
MILVDQELQEYSKTLCDLSAPIAERVDSLFCLRSFKQLEAIDALIEAFHKEPASDLLKHEICYCLGQMDNSPEHIAKIQPFLEMIVEGDFAHIITHEAVEALGNLNDSASLQLLEKYSNDPNKEKSEMVIETCELALDLLKWNEATECGKTEGIDLKKIKFVTNDPAPPFNYTDNAEYRDVAHLTKMLMSTEETLFNRYRAMFTLRELYTEESCVAIASTLLPEHADKCGALLKHEVAFVLAQMENVYKAAVPYLLTACTNPEEAAICKHESLVAVGEMIDDKAQIEHLLEHHDPIVAESCAVALNNMKNRLAEQAFWAAKNKEQETS